MTNNYIPNTSSIPNVLFDYWMEKLSPAEFKILMCIARKTYGWNKSHDLISIKQIGVMTGLHKSGIIKNVEKLVSIGLVNKVKSKTSDGDDAPNRFEINVYCVEGGSLQSRQGVVYSVDKGVVYSVDTQNPIYTKHNIQNNTPPTPPQESPSGDGGKAEPSSSKSKKVTSDFSDQVRDVADRMLKLVMKHETTYRPPEDMSKFLKCVKKMIEDEKQDIKVLMKAFEWAVTDNVERGTFKGWQSVICTNTVRGKSTNPAEIFHKNLSKINAQSKSRAPRKFDPSSDDQEALEKMKEMSSRAI